MRLDKDDLLRREDRRAADRDERLRLYQVRLYGLNWDQSQHLHPDERFLTMVATDIRLPSSLWQYFDNAKSPLNPYNYPQYQFFVYGTFPLFLTKFGLGEGASSLITGLLLAALAGVGEGSYCRQIVGKWMSKELGILGIY